LVIAQLVPHLTMENQIQLDVFSIRQRIWETEHNHGLLLRQLKAAQMHATQHLPVMTANFAPRKYRRSTLAWKIRQINVISAQQWRRISQQNSSFVRREHHMFDGRYVLQTHGSSQGFSKLSSRTVHELHVWMQRDRICRGQYSYEASRASLASSCFGDPFNCCKFIESLIRVFSLKQHSLHLISSFLPGHVLRALCLLFLTHYELVRSTPNWWIK